MKKILITLALLMSFAGSVSAALTTTYVPFPNIGKPPEETKTVSVTVVAGDVIVMSSATNKKPSVAKIVFTSTAGTFTELDAVTVDGGGLDVTNSYIAYLTIAADGTYDFTATGVPATITANVALYHLSASSGDVRHLDTKASAWTLVVDGDPIGGIDKLSWSANIDYGEIAVIGAGSSTKGDLSTTSLDLDITDNNGVKRLLGHKSPVNKGTISYHVTWKGTSQSGTAKDHGSTISIAFAEFGTAVVPTYSIGGTLSGMSGNITLQNNGGDNLVRNANGSFTFATEVTGAYSVTVSSQPTGQNCTVTNGSGTASADVTNVAVACVDIPTYSIGGTLSGLVGSVTLQNNGGDNLVLNADGGFTFATELLSGDSYAVTLSAMPVTQTCTVDSGGTGTVGSADITDVVVTCIDIPTYSIGGTLSGLSGSITLQNNGGDDLTLSADGSFTFATELLSGDAYAVTVSAEPATQTCTVTGGGSGTVADADITSVVVECVTVAKFTVGGTLSGLSGSVTLQNNGGDDLTLNADGSFTFSATLASGDAYAVTVLTQPATQTCTVSAGSGTIASADITDVAVSCADIPTHSIGGTVSGLTGGVTLQNNGADDLVVNADGSFTFATPVKEGDTYLVTVSAQPTDQTCTVTNGSGTVSAAVIDIVVDCVNSVSYSIGGTVSGLTASVTLQNNGIDDLVVSADGSFTFATAMNSGDTYTVTVSAQPTDQACTVTNGSGTATADVTDVVVDCVDTTIPPPVTGPATPIPTLSEWALMLLSMLLGLIVFTNRRRLFA